MSRGMALLASVLVLAACALPGSLRERAFSTGFKAGESLRYRLHTTVSGSLTLNAQQVPVSSDTTLGELLEVVSVDAAGTATVRVSTDDVSGSTGAAGSAVAGPAPLTLKIASDGRITSGAATQLSGRVPALPGSDQLTPVLPGHPVKPGDSWNRKYYRPNPFGAGGLSLASDSRYLMDDDVGGRAAAVIETDLDGQMDFTVDFATAPAGTVPAASGPIHYTGSLTSTRRYWLDVAGNEVLKSSGSGTYRLSYAFSAPSGSAAGPQQVDFSGRVTSEVTRI